MSPTRTFWIGMAVGVAVILLIVGVVAFYQRDEYICFTWGHPKELVQCRVH